MEKPRLFVDMDGTLAEFRKININVDELEGVKTAEERLYEILRTPGYFRSLAPQTNVVEAIKRIIEDEKIEVYIITCCLPDSLAQKEKNEWLNEYLPMIDNNHRIFVPDGANKRLYVPGYVEKSDYLLDDYTLNLEQWQIFGTGIKLLNGINNTNGRWQYSALSYGRTPKELANAIMDIINNKTIIIDTRPQDKSDEQEEYDR